MSNDADEENETIKVLTAIIMAGLLPDRVGAVSFCVFLKKCQLLSENFFKVLS